MENDARALPAREVAATRLLRRHLGARHGAAAFALAAEEASADLARRLVPLIGRSACVTLFGRALHLAQRASPPLARLTIEETAEAPLVHADVFAAAHTEDPHLVEAGCVALLAHVIGLLDALVGVGLTRHMLGLGGDGHSAGG
jgi:hypothetical protein